MDQEHQSLIALINRLVEPDIQRAEDPETWRGLVSELVRYAENHFRYEEERMDRVSYPDLEAHRIGHLRFRMQMSQLASESDLASKGTLTDLHAFLVAWLRDHVLREDRRYAPYLRGDLA